MTRKLGFWGGGVVAALMMRPPLLQRVQTNAQHQTQNEIPLN
jgi:hypothetical protein